MSLFRMIDWVTYKIDDASTLINAPIFEDRDQLVVGSENGMLTIVDPGNKKQHDVVLLSYQTKDPILQIEHGDFLSSVPSVLAVLSPSKLSYYKVQIESESDLNVSITELFTHNLEISAWNMCKIELVEYQVQLVVQTIDCKLSLYQGDQCVFVHCPLRSLHPGPISYCQSIASLITANNGFISAVKFSLLSSGSQKRINYDWTFNLGDTAIQLDLIDTPSQHMVVVLCRRHVTALDLAGTVKWQIKLEAVGTSICTYDSENGEDVRLVIATSDDNLLFFKNDLMQWNCNASMTACLIKVCSFSKILANVLTMLSADGNLSVGWLGTEPIFYKVPDAKMTNYNEKMNYWKSLEQKIKESNNNTSLGHVKKSAGIEVGFEIGERGKRTVEHNAANNVPYCTLQINFGELENVTKLHVNIESDFATPNNQLTVNVPESKTTLSLALPFYVGASGAPNNTRVKISAHCFHSQISVMQTFDLPFDLMFGEAGIDRNSKYKLTIDTDASVIAVNQLFPEFASENAQAIGFQVHGYDALKVSIFAANKSNRYRIQSEYPSLLQYVSRELVNRIRNHVKNVNVGSVIPFEYISKNVDDLQEALSKKKSCQDSIDCRMREVRAIELLSLDLSKSGKMEVLPQIDVLFDKSYRELLAGLDELAQFETRIKEIRRNLATLFQLASDVSKYNKVETIISEDFFTFTEQSLRERLCWATKTDRGNEMKLIERLCEHFQREMPKIEEEEADEEQENE